MRRRAFIAVLGAAAALPFAVNAEPAPGKWRIGVLAAERGQKLILQGLRELGYIEGQNMTVDIRTAIAGVDFAGPAAELVALKPDVIVAAGSQSALALKRLTGDIPIVMVSSDPVSAGLIESLAYPAGNITGLSLLSPEISGKRLELLREAVSGISSIAILWNSADPPAAIALQETQAAAGRAGLQVSVVAVEGPDDLTAALAAIESARPGGLVILAAPLMDIHRARIVAFARNLRLPSIYPDPTFAHDGGLMSYGPDFPAVIKSQTIYVDKILKGAKPGDLPVAQPTKFRLVINRKTATTIGIEMPPHLLALADEVIE